MKKQIKKGFTLAEVLITLTILGVVAALTIPSVMRTQNEAAERTKLKKAIVDYEKLISNMTIENSLTSIEALKDYANKDNCVKSRTYFKIKQDDPNSPSNNCIFQTSNGVWWNVTDITRPVISTKGVDDLSTADGENSFLLSTTYSDTARAFIVDDLSSSQLTDDEKAQLSKTLANAKLAEAKVIEEEKEPTLDDIRGWANTPCTGTKSKCTMAICDPGSGWVEYPAIDCSNFGDYFGKIIYGENENTKIQVGIDSFCSGNVDYCRSELYEYCNSNSICTNDLNKADYYDADGYDSDGYDKDGYDKKGIDFQGYNRDGVCTKPGEPEEERQCDDPDDESTCQIIMHTPCER